MHPTSAMMDDEGQTTGARPLSALLVGGDQAAGTGDGVALARISELLSRCVEAPLSDELTEISRLAPTDPPRVRERWTQVSRRLRAVFTMPTSGCSPQH